MIGQVGDPGRAPQFKYNFLLPGDKQRYERLCREIQAAVNEVIADQRFLQSCGIEPRYWVEGEEINQTESEAQGWVPSSQI